MKEFLPAFAALIFIWFSMAKRGKEKGYGFFTRNMLSLMFAVPISFAIFIYLLASRSEAPEPEIEKPISSQASINKKPESFKVTQSDFGAAWPFTEDTAVLSCQKQNVIIAHVGGVNYALTGAGRKLGYTQIDRDSIIWRDDPTFPADKVSLINIQETARTLCDGNTEPVRPRVTEDQKKEKQAAIVLSANAAPIQYDNITTMMEAHNDYSDENGTFKLISSNPLHIQLSPITVSGETEEVRQSEMQRTAIYGIFRTFLHTDAEQVRVTVFPMEIQDFKNYKTRYLDKPKTDITITHAGALMAVQKFIKIKSLNELVSSVVIGDPDEEKIQIDGWSKSFQPHYYDSKMQNTLLKELQRNSDLKK